MVGQARTACGFAEESNLRRRRPQSADMSEERHTSSYEPTNRFLQVHGTDVEGFSGWEIPAQSATWSGNWDQNYGEFKIFISLAALTC